MAILRLQHFAYRTTLARNIGPHLHPALRLPACSFPPTSLDTDVTTGSIIFRHPGALGHPQVADPRHQRSGVLWMPECHWMAY